MAPYLLFGFAAAGVLSVLVSPEAVERHLGGAQRPWWAVVKASLFGVPLPLCSCGVIPVAASLRNHGASRGATVSFLISTPQTGVDSLMVTYGFLGPVFAAFRVVAAFVSGVAGGMAVDLLGGVEETGAAALPSGKGRASREWKRGGWREALHYGFVALPRDIGSAMLMGLAVAGLIGALLPPQFFHELLGPLAARLGPGWANFASMLVMMAIGIPTYVCATASVPIAAALVAKGVSPGAAFVFLMTGPATNAATVAMVWKTMGKKTAWVYLAAIAAMALLSGWALDMALPDLRVSMGEHAHHAGSGLWETLSGLALLAVLGAAVFPPWLRRAGLLAEISGGGTLMEKKAEGAVILKVAGMTCGHCVASVHKALSECEGVESVEVDLAAGKAVVMGAKADAASLVKTVEGLGYSAVVG
ncbi:MAG: SO_0444 family Cu/Zn efflux transporter [Elusimicrobia bacterium]|nr:SO_0444 family Cu/Zn efflux transporter [Elusimicrobiota bacterium]